MQRDVENSKTPTVLKDFHINKVKINTDGDLGENIFIIIVSCFLPPIFTYMCK